MKITLDHNCIINLANGTGVGRKVQSVISDTANEGFVVNIGASEMREKGVRPDHYDKFEELLTDAGIEHLPRLDPLMVWDVTFWDRAIWGDEDTEKEIAQIDAALFENAPPLDVSSETEGSPIWRKWLNRQGDIHTMWCHIHNDNDVFLTTDENFMKATTLPKLLAIGAKRICRPDEL